MKRRTVIVNSVLGVALLAVGVTAAIAVTGGGGRPVPTGTTVPVQRGTVTATVTATGNVEAGSTVFVTSPGSGKVTEIDVEAGQQVDQGDKLFSIDDTTEKQ
ncbi:MAG TPA: biotin/lipoyl-binding protein, partial [Microlunatus sp.]|nr:biotin/lipoyl-binding protein [Microlunatus sp.]